LFPGAWLAHRLDALPDSPENLRQPCLFVKSVHP